ncbi:Nucleoside triphosphate pyrophosphohydrolase MazG [hydrothermal vent metagenome]|uniref:Nucleoside triphosphate pyrophosphohydrolase MazG n=1 Tax=hydrothermal vent metagenome TaxID=652676 RepID=A0A3B1DA06_9ZZZZ
MQTISETPGTPPDYTVLVPAFSRLCDIIAKLRSPDGCPWDRVQTLETIKPHTLEETYELLEAIDSGDDVAIVEELGDLLLQVLLDAQIGADEGRFQLIDVVEALANKMVTRHPHVFGDAKAETEEEVKAHWNKAKEKENKPNRESVLDGIPFALPQLARAEKLSQKAAKVGFDFPHRDMLFDKLREEIKELGAELFEGGNIPQTKATVEAEVLPDEPIQNIEQRERVENEIGDLLFVVANIARRWKINPEEALRKSNRKFFTRFRYIEKELQAEGKSISEATLQEMENLYQKGKSKETE